MFALQAHAGMIHCKAELRFLNHTLIDCTAVSFRRPIVHPLPIRHSHFRSAWSLTQATRDNTVHLPAAATLRGRLRLAATVTCDGLLHLCKTIIIAIKNAL